MATIKVNLTEPLRDGMDIKFQAPCDCTAVTSLTLTYPTEAGGTASKTVTMMDTHGNRLTGIGNLFMQGAYVKIMVDSVNGVAYLQNADTNGYLEGEFDKLRALHLDDGNGCFYREVDGEVEWINPPMVVGTEYRTTERFAGKPVYTTVTWFKPSGGESSGTYSLTVRPSNGTVDLVLRCSGFTNTGVAIPYNVHQPESTSYRQVQVNKTSGAIGCTCSWGTTAYSADETWYIQLWFTKE